MGATSPDHSYSIIVLTVQFSEKKNCKIGHLVWEVPKLELSGYTHPFCFVGHFMTQQCADFEKIEVEHFFCRVATLKNQLFQKMKNTVRCIFEKLLYTKFQLKRSIGSRDTPGQTDRQTAIQKPLFRIRGAR